MQASDYSVERTRLDGIDTAILKDSGREMEVRIAVSAGNIAYDFRVKNQQLFFQRSTTIAKAKEARSQIGNPFLGPWANRVEGFSYRVDGKEYLLNRELGNLRMDGNGNPIHGLLLFDERWHVVRAESGDHFATVTSRLDFYKWPDLMAQFPFAHAIEMTYSLKDGSLEVETAIENLGAARMPMAIGFHPWFQIADSPRDEWEVTTSAHLEIPITKQSLPAGDPHPSPYPAQFKLAGTNLDNLFTGLERDSGGLAHFSVKGKQQKITVSYGPKYPVAVLYSPLGVEFVCIEPMAAPTNVFALADSGAYRSLQFVEAGDTWRESYWIRPEGY